MLVGNDIRKINFSKTNVVNLSLKSNYISFKGKEDVFTSIPEVVKGSIKEDELNSILSAIKEQKPQDSGYTSKIFKLGNKIIKVPIDKTFSHPEAKQMALRQNLAEFYALDKIQEIDTSIAAKPFGVIRDKDKYYLVEEVIEGIHPQGHKVTKEHLTDLLDKFFKLDTNGIANCDLQNGNIFLLNNGKTKLIDFGAFNFIADNGDISGSDYAIKEFFSEDTSLRFLKTFLVEGGYVDTKNLADNPNLRIPSNASNFEFRFLYTHLLDNSEENPLEFFKEYLKLKSQNYHEKLKEFLNTLSFKQINTKGLSENVIEKANQSLENAINYEQLIKEVLSNPTDDVVKVELAKLQLRTFLNLGDSLNSPIENIKKLQAAYNQLISLLEENIKNSDGNKKEYYIQTLNSYKAKFKDYVFEQGQVEIPENENLLKALFKKPQITKENSDNIKQIAKKSNNKLGLFIAFGALITTGLIAYIIKRKKNPINSKIQTTNDVAPKNNTNSNLSVLNNTYLSKNMPDAFKNFKK